MQIVTGEVGVDFLHQRGDAAERATPNCLLGDQAEPALHLIEPTGIGRWVISAIYGLFEGRWQVAFASEDASAAATPLAKLLEVG